MSSPSPFQPQTNTISLPPISALLSMAEADRSTSNTPHQHTRRSTHSHNGFIDLTRDSPSSPSTSLTGTPSHSRNSKEPPEKRRRIGGEGSGSRRILFEPPPLDPSNYPRHNDNIILLDDVEEVDLTEVGGERGLRKIQEDQRKRHEKLQEQQNHLLKDSVQAQESEKDGPVKLSKITCVICMENMTNITATHCGTLLPLTDDLCEVSLTHEPRTFILPYLYNGSTDCW